MDSTTMKCMEAGSAKKPALTDYLLPAKELCLKFGEGYVITSILGVIRYQVLKDVSADPWRTQLRRAVLAGQYTGGRLAYIPVVIASVEHFMATLRGKNDLLNSFVAGAVLGSTFGFGRGPILASASSLVFGSVAAFVAYDPKLATPVAYHPEPTAPTSLQATGA